MVALLKMKKMIGDPDYRAKLSLYGWLMSSRMIFLKAKKMKKSDAGGFLFRLRESYRPPDFRCSRPPDVQRQTPSRGRPRNRIFPRDQVLVFFLILLFLFFWVNFFLFCFYFYFYFLFFLGEIFVLSLSNRHFQCETHFHHKNK